MIPIEYLLLSIVAAALFGYLLAWALGKSGDTVLAEVLQDTQNDVVAGITAFREKCAEVDRLTKDLAQARSDVIGLTQLGYMRDRSIDTLQENLSSAALHLEKYEVELEAAYQRLALSEAESSQQRIDFS
jgi:hypothetical protein